MFDDKPLELTAAKVVNGILTVSSATKRARAKRIFFIYQKSSTVAYFNQMKGT